MKELEIYVHIPFCVRKCNYCDFLSFAADDRVKRRYTDSLMKEIGQFEDRGDYAVPSVFFGGGTPSILPAGEIGRILGALKEKFVFLPDAEITVECNPGTVDREKLLLYRKEGINRLSFGLQSADNKELKTLGRIHTWEDFLESYGLARERGFDNINIDLMSALPGQSVKSWETTLKKVLALDPEHISAYSLIIEEGTLFYDLYAKEDEKRRRGEETRLLPSEEEERQMYELTEQMLAMRGYRRYEISNYAKEGRQCLHNCGYWQRKMYRGFGLGAASFMEERRFKNTENLEEYMRRAQNGESCAEAEEKLERGGQMEEFMFLGLRMTEGVREDAFEAYFEVPVEHIYGDVLKKLEKDGLLKRKEGRIFLTEHGIDISNYVLAQFLLD